VRVQPLNLGKRAPGMARVVPERVQTFWDWSPAASVFVGVFAVGWLLWEQVGRVGRDVFQRGGRTGRK